MKKQIEVDTYVHWDDDKEEWVISDDFKYEDGCTYWFYCNVSAEVFEIVKVGDELQVHVYCGECPWNSESPYVNNLKEFLATEKAGYVRTTGMPLPSINPLAIEVSDCPLVQQYVSTRLHYYGGGRDKLKAARAWADEAMTNPQQLH